MTKKVEKLSFFLHTLFFFSNFVRYFSFFMSEQIRHEGVVEHVADGHVRVLIEQRAACSACKAKSMCTASDTMVKEVVAEMLEPMKVGDHVVVEVARRLGWKAVLLAFVIPFCILLIGVAVLPGWLESEVWGGLTALLLLVPYYLVLHLFQRKFEAEYRFTARKE